MKWSIDSACKVTFEYFEDSGQPKRISVFLAEDLLWSPEGLASIFNIGRSYLADPREYPQDEKIESAWDSFHVFSIEQVNGFVSNNKVSGEDL
jgi:hypothetical protein